MFPYFTELLYLIHRTRMKGSYIYIYIYILFFLLKIIDIFLFTYIFVNPFEFPDRFSDIRQKLVNITYICLLHLSAWPRFSIYAQFPMHHLFNPVMSTLVFFLCQFVAFIYYVCHHIICTWYSSVDYQFSLCHYFGLRLKSFGFSLPFSTYWPC